MCVYTEALCPFLSEPVLERAVSIPGGLLPYLPFVHFSLVSASTSLPWVEPSFLILSFFSWYCFDFFFPPSLHPSPSILSHFPELELKFPRIPTVDPSLYRPWAVCSALWLQIPCVYQYFLSFLKSILMYLTLCCISPFGCSLESPLNMSKTELTTITSTWRPPWFSVSGNRTSTHHLPHWKPSLPSCLPSQLLHAADGSPWIV